MISVVVLTKNEEKNIGDCLDTLSWCDELIVIDDNSQDNTKSIAEKKGAKVFTHSLDGNFASQRNFGLSKAKGDWVLFIDADERVSENLALEIKKQELQTQKDTQGYLFKRYDNLFGRTLRHGEIGDVRLLRFAKKGSGKWKRRVHETWKIHGKTEILENPLQHFPHQTLREFVFDINMYSTLHAQEKFEAGERSSLFKIWYYSKFKFFNNFFLKLGFLDGGVGFIVALLMSFHSFLSWSKLLILQKKSK